VGAEGASTDRSEPDAGFLSCRRKEKLLGGKLVQKNVSTKKTRGGGLGEIGAVFKKGFGKKEKVKGP